MNSKKAAVPPPALAFEKLDCHSAAAAEGINKEEVSCRGRLACATIPALQPAANNAPGIGPDMSATWRMTSVPEVTPSSMGFIGCVHRLSQIADGESSVERLRDRAFAAFTLANL
jgi:hypothetical protein